MIKNSYLQVCEGNVHDLSKFVLLKTFMLYTYFMSPVKILTVAMSCRNDDKIPTFNVTLISGQYYVTKPQTDEHQWALLCHIVSCLQQSAVVNLCIYSSFGNFPDFTTNPLTVARRNKTWVLGFLSWGTFWDEISDWRKNNLENDVLWRPDRSVKVYIT